MRQALDAMEELWGGAGTSGILDGFSKTELSDLTVPQVSVLMFLRPGPRRIGSLAERLGTSLPSATSIANRLEQRGLIERMRDEKDGRAVLCCLTPCGEERIDALYEHERSIILEGLGSLDLGELGTIVHALGLLSRAVVPVSDDPDR
jgi:DNA-binding MarR family transcriptional regulator